MTTAQDTKTATKVATPSIVLKTVHNDILRDNPNSTLTTKQMRAKLRVKMNDVHVRNSSWIFTEAQYEEVRSMFDEAYRAKAEGAQKAVKTPRAKKPRAKAATQKAVKTPRAKKPRAKAATQKADA